MHNPQATSNSNKGDSRSLLPTLRFRWPLQLDDFYFHSHTAVITHGNCFTCKTSKWKSLLDYKIHLDHWKCPLCFAGPVRPHLVNLSVMVYPIHHALAGTQCTPHLLSRHTCSSHFNLGLTKAFLELFLSFQPWEFNLPFFMWMPQKNLFLAVSTSPCFISHSFLL